MTLKTSNTVIRWVDRRNTTPTVRGICTFAVLFSVSRPFLSFTLVCEGHFVGNPEPSSLDSSSSSSSS